ncbi:hypothetical protein GCM10020369_36310 [Cryptosporangium minutisporangium]|uniref:Bifunctional diguanylate cyclase/phosphodiesterase n=1 Tax=Cryptosporangium minutisporangium TaxID=113569 RepID=A0ABP6SYN9_9ACTN
MTQLGPVGWWQAPVVATPWLMAAVTGACSVVAGLVAMIIAWCNEPLREAVGETAVGAAAIVVGVFLGVRARRWPRIAFHGVVGSAVAVTTLLIWLARDEGHATAYVIIYSLVSLFTLFFFSWPAGVVHQVVIAASLAVAQLVWQAVPGSVVFALVSINALVAVIIGMLVRMAADADMDPLTGLFNRRGLDRALDEAFADREVTGRAMSVAIVNLDGFRVVNQRIGRAQADRLLRATARAWRLARPAGGTLARTRGDEFVLLLPGADASAAATQADALRALLELPCGLSAGVAEASQAESASHLLGRADAALRRAKREEPGSTVVDTPSDARNQDMVRALPAGEFAVVYQPIVNLATGAVRGAEALLRWTHPERGAIPPVEFIPVAEQSGFILDLGRWVLRTACQEAAGWDWADNPRVTVNVSGRQLHDPCFVQDVRQILAETGLAPSRLVLEITESMVEADAPSAFAALSTLRRDGVQVAIDDFGTGYSSLSRLDRLPVDILKIDQSFVRALRPEGAISPVITAVVALARAMGMTTVAEGIEEPYQAAALRAHGVDAGQGWLYGKPGTPHALATTAATEHHLIAAG